MANVQRFWPSQKVSNWLSAGMAWSGSTANGLATYSSATEIVAESTATYDGTTLQLTTSGGGLKLDNLDSSNANTLDDYEEGTATVALAPASGSLTMGTATVGYTKVGRMVTVSGRVFVTGISSPSGDMTMTGLPFAVKSTAAYEPMGTGYLWNQASGAGGVGVAGQHGSTTANMVMLDSAAFVQGGVIDADTEFQFTVTYAI